MNSHCRFLSQVSALGWFLVAASSWAGPGSQSLFSFNVKGPEPRQGSISVRTDGSGNLSSLFSGSAQASIQQLKQGMVLHRNPQAGEVLKIVAAPSFSASSGGTLTIRYLKKFDAADLMKLTKPEYGEFRMTLVREGNRWVAKGTNAQTFDAGFLSF